MTFKRHKIDLLTDAVVVGTCWYNMIHTLLRDDLHGFGLFLIAFILVCMSNRLDK